MNVVFRVLGPDGQPNQERESAFVKQAESHKLMSLKGHRDVGGIRASLYNAVEMDSVEKLIAFMEDFAKRN